MQVCLYFCLSVLIFSDFNLFFLLYLSSFFHLFIQLFLSVKLQFLSYYIQIDIFLFIFLHS